MIDEGDLHILFRGSLNGLGHAADFGAVIGIGWGDMHGQEMTQRVDSQMQLGALLAFCAIVVGARQVPGSSARCGCR
jgi:hypothetical protein